MSHVRTQIRQAAVAALQATGRSVSASRVYPLAADTLPAFLVFTAAEEIEGDFSTMTRKLALLVECVAAGDTYDDMLDTLLVEAEERLTGDLGGLVLSSLPRLIEVSASAEGSAPIGRARITFEVVYRTTYTDPETST